MVDKSISAVLNGIAKQDYFKEPDITDDFLHQEIFPNLPAEEFHELLSKFRSILKNIIYSNMDINQLEAFLTSQMKRRENYLSELQYASVIKFWRANKEKLHNVMYGQSCFNNKLKSFKWRIDLHYSHDNGINEPKAIFEMDVASRKQNNSEKVIFESSCENLDYLVQQIEKIEAAVERIKQ